ncbi:unnamed protein product [Brassicogethes aeneus]|uniref:THUMP domain-containing protein n=1 Tax=Brassicogethes aeneus TaxID=1431903 RepID=A0A9P0AXM5_BRAAE|nr:unnamed protein product [Brassicogethes aeneus]
MSESKSVKPKSNYKKYPHRQNRFSMDVNLKGFLCSCNGHEKDCVKESYNLLNKYADILYPEEEEKVDDDESDDLQKDIQKMQKKKTKFQVLESGAKNILFVKTTLEDPVLLAHKIVTDINETKSQQTRFLIRLVPIETTCKANMKDLEKAFTPLLEKHFKSDPVNFAIVYNHRNDKGLTRDEVIKKLGEMIADTKIDHKVNLKEADVSIIVEVVRSFVFIGVVPDFIKYKKYNLISAPIDNKTAEISGE